MRNLLDYASLKLLAQRVRVMQIERKRDLVSIRFDAKAEVDAEKLAQFVARHRGAQFTPQGMLKFSIKSNQADEVLESLRQVLENIASESVTAAGWWSAGTSVRVICRTVPDVPQGELSIHDLRSGSALDDGALR